MTPEIEKKIRKSKLSINGLPESWLFPTTRYRGSKRKILSWIWENIRDINFDSALDLFGGTSSVSLLLKRMGKEVTFNDYLKFNQVTGIAFISNKNTNLTEEDIEYITSKHEDIQYKYFIQDTFKGFYLAGKRRV